VIAHQDTVIPTVIVALKLDELHPAGYSSRQPECYLNNLRSAVGIADLVRTRDHLHQMLGDFVLQVMLRAEGESSGRCACQRLVQLSRCMSQNVRAPGQRVIEIGISIDVHQRRSVSMIEVKRIGLGIAA